MHIICIDFPKGLRFQTFERQNFNFTSEANSLCQNLLPFESMHPKAPVKTHANLWYAFYHHTAKKTDRMFNNRRDRVLFKQHLINSSRIYTPNTLLRKRGKFYGPMGVIKS